MSQYPWLRPEFAPASTVVTVVLVALWCVLVPLTGRRGYRVLEAARAAGDTSALLRRYRRAVTRQAATVAVVLALVALDGGIGWSDIGVARPAGGTARFAVGYSIVLSVVVVLAGLVMRRRALRGGSVPGQQLFRALLPHTRRERRVSVLVALGAGVAEEVLFRGLFTAAGVDLLAVPVVWSAVLVCVLFGVAHSYQGWRGMIGTAVVGAFMSYLYLSSHSLLPAVLLHVVIDLRAFVIVPPATYGPRRSVAPRATSPVAVAPAPAAPERRRPAPDDDLSDRPPVLP